MSCLHWRSSPVLRQATGLPHNGIFEDFTGLVLTRTATVILPSKEMVVMAIFKAIQCTPMPDIRQLTACSRKWAAERPRCLSLTVREADNREAQQATQQREALLRAPFGITALVDQGSREKTPLGRQLAHLFTTVTAAAAPQAKAEGSRPVACASASAQEEEFVWISNIRLATMEWLPMTWSAESDQTAPSRTVPCKRKGVRRGHKTQGLAPGCAFAFATRDLPGRYDGVWEGRSVATN